MKKLTLLLTALLLLLCACNKIDPNNTFHIIPQVEVTSYDPEYAKTVVQKIYVEEFTGHTCTYCPDGARRLKAIMDEDTTVIATAIHCSSLADPGNKPPFNRNYKTPMGDILCHDFIINGLPKAMINRMEVSANTWKIERTQWRSFIAQIDRNNVRAGIQLQCAANEAKQDITVRVAVTIIKEIPNPVQLCVVLQQDGFVSGQIDGSVEILNYVHNHVLRAGFNGNYGTYLTPNGLVNAQNKYTTSLTLSYQKPLPYLNLPVELSNCHIVAYLIDMVTKEVIQVEEVAVM